MCLSMKTLHVLVDTLSLHCRPSFWLHPWCRVFHSVACFAPSVKRLSHRSCHVIGLSDVRCRKLRCTYIYHFIISNVGFFCIALLAIYNICGGLRASAQCSGVHIRSITVSRTHGSL